MAFGAFAPFPFRLGGDTFEGWTAAQHARVCADLVSAKRTAPLAVITYTISGTVVTIQRYLGQNGVGLAYAPTATRLSTGTCSFNWPSLSFTDPYGITKQFKLRDAKATAHSFGAAVTAGCYLSFASAWHVLVVTFDTTGTLVDAPATVVVW